MVFDEPSVDVDEWRDVPVRHRYVHGGFAGTETRFSIYSPRSTSMRVGSSSTSRRCPTASTSRRARRASRTGSASPSRAVATSSRPTAAERRVIPVHRWTRPLRPTCQCRRRRVLAGRRRQMYGEHRPYGYAYGGSGGGYRTIGGAENTSGVWDGFVPYVIGSPMAIPNMFTVRMHAQRVLRDRLRPDRRCSGAGRERRHVRGPPPEERDALARGDPHGVPAAFVVRSPHHGHARASRCCTGAWSRRTPRTSRSSGPSRLSGTRAAALVAARPRAGGVRDGGLITDGELSAAGRAGEGSPARLAAGSTRRGAGTGPDPRPPVRSGCPAPRRVDVRGADLYVLSGAAKGARIGLLSVVADIAVFGPAGRKPFV